MQLCVEEVSVTFSWLGTDGDVNIITTAVTMETRVERHRWMGQLESTWRKNP